MSASYFWLKIISKIKIIFHIKMILVTLIFASVSIFACKKAPELTNLKISTIDESFQTERNEADNIDSPAVWHGSEGQNWLIATAKEADVLMVHDASNASFIQRIGASGTNPGFFKRPNGIFIIDSLAIIVERDNHRVQVMKLPEFLPLGFIGEAWLSKPYGLYVNKVESDRYSIYVTDCYETNQGEIPENNELGKRVHQYSFSIESDTVKWELTRMFGDTTGNGILRVVESIYGDPIHNHLLIAEEEETQTSVKVYDLDGNFTGKIIGSSIFKYQVEGIALYQTSAENGYWIITDQSHQNNLFHVFDRTNFSYIASFRGKNTTNTDGIWLTQKSFNNFPHGAFYAVHNDGNVSAFDWRIIADALGLDIF